MSRAPEASYVELRCQVVDLITSMERAPVIGISGHGGAGKSTLAARLMTDLGGTPEQVIRTDCFYAEDAGPSSGLFDLHDWPTLYDLLRRIRAAKDPKLGLFPGNVLCRNEQIVGLVDWTRLNGVR